MRTTPYPTANCHPIKTEHSACDHTSTFAVSTMVRCTVVLVALPWHKEGHQAMPLGHASILSQLAADPLLDVHSIVRPVNASGFSAQRVAEEIAIWVKDVPNHTAVVAIGAYVWNDDAVREIIKHLREGGFRCRIVLGGPQITYAIGGLELLYPEVSAFVRGAGEEALHDYLRLDSSALVTGMHLAGTDDRRTKAFTTLYTLPSPWLVGTLDAKTSKSVHWESQRGCPFSCSFCQHRHRSDKTAISAINVHRAMSEIDLLCDSGVKRISVLDPVFNMNEARASEILHRFIERDFKGEISLQCRAEMINLENPVFLDAANKLDVTLEFGLQSIVEAELQAIQRPNNMRKIAAVLDEVKRRGIRQEVSLIYGLPEQTLDSFRASVDWCLQRQISSVLAFPLLLLRGTALDERRADWRLITSKGTLPMVISSSTFCTSEWQAMDYIASALAWAADNERNPLSVEQLLHAYEEADAPRADTQQRVLGRVQ